MSGVQGGSMAPLEHSYLFATWFEDTGTAGLNADQLRSEVAEMLDAHY
jgi:hypothetical protein